MTAIFETPRSPIWRSCPCKSIPRPTSRRGHATLRLAERHQLTLYDAAYLELALRRNLPLATLDEDLRRAVRAEKVKLLG
jgi:predicted nucleic acid-binding protein